MIAPLFALSISTPTVARDHPARLRPRLAFYLRNDDTLKDPTMGELKDPCPALFGRIPAQRAAAWSLPELGAAAKTAGGALRAGQVDLDR